MSRTDWIAVVLFIAAVLQLIWYNRGEGPWAS